MFYSIYLLNVLQYVPHIKHGHLTLRCLTISLNLFIYKFIDEEQLKDTQTVAEALIQSKKG